MNTDKPEEADLLDQYWDALLQGDAFDADQIDPATAETLQRLHRRTIEPGPDPLFVERLRRQLTGSVSENARPRVTNEPTIPPDEGLVHDVGHEIAQPSDSMPKAEWETVTGDYGRRGWLGQAGQIAAALVAFSVLTGLLVLVFRDGGDTAESGPGIGSAAGTPTASERSIAPAELQSSVLVLRSEGEQQGEIRPVDPATGEPVPGYALTSGEESGFIVPHAVSPNGARLAVVESQGRVSEPSAGGTATRASADALRLVDLSSWHEVTVTLPGEGWVQPLVFSPEAERIALVYHDYPAETLMLFDVESGDLVAQRDLAFRPSLIDFTPDGTDLVLYGQPLGENPGITRPDPPQVLLLDAADLEVVWDQTLSDVLSGRWCLEQCQAPHQNGGVFAEWEPGVVPSPGGRTLYIAHADEEKLTTVDFQARGVETVDLRVEQSLSSRLLGLFIDEAEAKGEATGGGKDAAISPDGSRLYVVGDTVTATPGRFGDQAAGEETPAWLRVIDPASGRVIASRELDGMVSEVKTTTDGRNLFLRVWNEGESRTDVVDAGSLERVARLNDWEEIEITRRLGGRPVLLARQHEYSQGRSTTQFAVLDPESFEITGSWSVDGYAFWVVP